MIGQRAVDLIVESEVTSRKVYEKRYRRPEWPKGRSGVTIGIGYDLGYASRAKITKDWANRVDPAMLQAMLRCSGVTGEAAHDLCNQVKSAIDIPWDDAMAVFLDTDIVEWTQRVIDHIPAAKDLPPDCLGSIVSIAYNRGASFDNQGDRYKEMRAIKTHVQAGEHQWPRVAQDIRDMKRLWVGTGQNGLLARREAEAALFEDGLKHRTAAPAVILPKEAPEPQLPYKEAGAAEGLGAGAGIAGTTALAKGHMEVLTLPELALLLVAGIVVAAIIFFAIRTARRADPYTGRAKDYPEGATL